MIYIIRKDGQQVPEPNYMKALQAYRSGGLPGLKKHLDSARKAGAISGTDAYVFHHHIMNYMNN